jgi:3D (Asp-Asp-Asp) domain-containing protein
MTSRILKSVEERRNHIWGEPAGICSGREPSSRTRQLTPQALRREVHNMKKMNLKKIAAGALLAVGVLAFGHGNHVEAAAASKNIAPVTVQKGDTISKIAARYGTSVNAWKYTNNLASDKILAGQNLNVAFKYRVYPGDQLGFLAERYNTTVGNIMTLNGMIGSNIVGGQTLIIPVGKHHTAAPAPAVKPVAKPAAPAPAVKPVAKPAAPAVKPAVPTVAGKPYSKTVNANATAYGPGNIMWQWGGQTFTGTQVREGVIAVDPKVIPLGSKVWVTGYHSPLLPAGGFMAIAEDTGGAIKGNRIDIYIDGSQANLNDFGMQGVKVYVLK